MTPSPAPDNPQDGVSPKVKFFVILLTIATVVAFSVFFYKLVTRVVSPANEKNWAGQLLTVGDELRKAGLKEQAIGQYKKFLGQDKIDLKTRARVSLALGELYTELGNCPEALVWLFQARIAEPAPVIKEALQGKINMCLKEIQSAHP